MAVIRLRLPNKAQVVASLGGGASRPSLDGIHVNMKDRVFEVCDGFCLFRIPFNDGGMPELNGLESFVIGPDAIKAFLKGKKVGKNDQLYVSIGIDEGEAPYGLAIIRNGVVMEEAPIEPLTEKTGLTYPDLGRLVEDATRTDAAYTIGVGTDVMESIVKVARALEQHIIRFEFRNENGMVRVDFGASRMDGQSYGSFMPMVTPENTENGRRRAAAEKAAADAEHQAKISA